MEEGWRLWERAPRPRQNSIALPDLFLEQFRLVGAEVQDRIALTRCVLERLGLATDDIKKQGLNNRAARFWTEHSSRPSLPSWARALGVPKELTDRLGYWGSGGESAEVYIRNYRGAIKRVQEMVARYMREGHFPAGQGDPLPDLFGEHEVATKLRGHLGDDAQDLAVSIPWSRSTGKIADDAVRKFGWNSTELVDKDAENKKVEAELDTASDKEAEAEVVPAPPSSAWVITRAAINKKNGCLHVIGRCHRIPGLHYKYWCEVAEGAGGIAFSKACKQCFPLGHPEVHDAHLESVEINVDSGMPDEVPEEASQ